MLHLTMRLVENQPLTTIHPVIQTISRFQEPANRIPRLDMSMDVATPINVSQKHREADHPGVSLDVTGKAPHKMSITNGQDHGQSTLASAHLLP